MFAVVLRMTRIAQLGDRKMEESALRFGAGNTDTSAQWLGLSCNSMLQQVG